MVNNPKLKMQEAVKLSNYLKLISLINFDLWDTKRYTSRGISSFFEIVELGSCIKEENGKYKLFEEEKQEFGILGVNNKEGIFDAYTQKGKDINQPYKKMEIGWLAYNPYRINVGSIGVRLEEHKNEYISPAYVVFSCYKNLLPRFLFLLFKTNIFNKIINESTTGSVRQNLTIDILKKLKIPLPSIAEQERIIDAYSTKVKDANILQGKAEILQRSIDEYLFEELGIRLNNKKKQDNYISEISFENIERWSVDHIKQTIDSNFIFKGKYEPIRLKEIIEGYQYGLSEKASRENVGIPMLRMNNIYNSELKTDNLKYISKTQEVNRFILNKGDLLFNRTNSKELVGKTAIFDREEEFTFASYLIRVVINNKVADPYFINYLFNSPILQFQKDLVSRQITGQANINAQEMREFLFPLPPIEKQKELVESLTKMRALILNHLKDSSKLIETAEEQFEQAIFN
jgi:type I restriction enzyme S subunit